MKGRFFVINDGGSNMINIKSGLKRRTHELNYLIARITIVLGASIVGISSFHHWLRPEGNIMMGYFFIRRNELYQYRTILAVLAGIVFLNAIVNRYMNIGVYITLFIGVVALIYPQYMIYLANERSYQIFWVPGLAYYSTIGGATLLIFGAGLILSGE